MAKANVRCHGGKLAKAKRYHTKAAIQEANYRQTEEPRKPYEHSLKRQAEIDAHNKRVFESGMFR
jgi:hypothetical protein